MAGRHDRPADSERSENVGLLDMNSSKGLSLREIVPTDRDATRTHHNASG